MKKLFIFLLMLVSVLNIYSQDKEPTQKKFKFNSMSEDSVYLSQDSLYFKQVKFMLGWHWGASKKISKALRINHKDAGSLHEMSIDSINEGTYLTVRSMDQPPPDWTYPPDTMIYYTHCDEHTQLVHAKAIQYEPTLQILSSDTLSLDTNKFDNMNPVFGFKFIKGYIQNDEEDNRSRLVLAGDTLKGQVVLEGLNYKNIFANNYIFL